MTSVAGHMGLWRVATAALLGLALTGCDAPVASDTAVRRDLPASPSAGPGARDATGDEAVALFTAVCLQTAPNYRAADTVMATMPFTRNSRTGTVYHNVLNLSVKVTDQGCSLVAAGRKLNGTVDTQSLVSADPTGKTLPRRPVRLQGDTYISVIRPIG